MFNLSRDFFDHDISMCMLWSLCYEPTTPSRLILILPIYHYRIFSSKEVICLIQFNWFDSSIIIKWIIISNPSSKIVPLFGTHQQCTGNKVLQNCCQLLFQISRGGALNWFGCGNGWKNSPAKVVPVCARNFIDVIMRSATLPLSTLTTVFHLLSQKQCLTRAL